MWLTLSAHFCKEDGFVLIFEQTIRLYIECTTYHVVYRMFFAQEEMTKRGENRHARTQTQTMDKSIKNAICNHTKKLICRPAHLLRYLFSSFFFSLLVHHLLLLHIDSERRKERKCERKKVHVKSKKFHQIQYVRATQANHECTLCIPTTINCVFSSFFRRAEKNESKL